MSDRSAIEWTGGDVESRDGLLQGVTGVRSLPTMTTLRFKIGEAFPAGDPVARFITIVAMMSNDWLRLIEDMMALEDANPDAVVPAHHVVPSASRAA